MPTSSAMQMLETPSLVPHGGGGRGLSHGYNRFSVAWLVSDQ